MTTHYSGTFVSTTKVRLAEYVWEPSGTARACVVLVHGYAEHAGRYRHVAQHLVDAGYFVAAYDHLGHGRSEGRRAFVDTFDTYVDDLALFVERLERRSDALPLVLLAHSMGCLVAGLYAARTSRPLDGLILSGAAVRTPIAPTLQRISRWIGEIAPRLPTVPLDRSGISRDEAVVLHANADPLNYHGRVLARTGAEIVAAGSRLLKAANRLTAPLLLLHGSDDPIADPAGSRDLYAAAAASDKTRLVFEDLYHEILNEPERQQVLHAITAWIDERVPAEVPESAA